MMSNAIHESVQKFDCFVFDCDGVIWKGVDKIYGAAKSLNQLVANEKRVMYCTNNSMHSTQAMIDKLKFHGITLAREEDIVCPCNVMPDVAADCVDEAGTVVVVGEAGGNLVESFKSSSRKEISKVVDLSIDIRTYGTPVESVSNENFIFCPEASVIVIGYDPDMTYLKISWVLTLVRNREARGHGTTVLFSNPDVNFPLGSGLRIPGTGSICAAYSAALSTTSCTIKECGKPFGMMAENILRRTGLDKSKICMVGDNLLTDIAFGELYLGGSILVETGIHTKKDIPKLCSEVYPEPSIILDSIRDVA